MRISPARCLYAGILLIICGSPVLAQSTAVPPGITLDSAIAQALAKNPELTAFGYQLDIRQGDVEQAGLRPNPELTVSVENAAGSGEFSGFDGLETTLSVGWILERNKRQHRVNAAMAGVSAMEVAAESKRQDVTAQTARLFLESLVVQQRLELLTYAVSLYETEAEFARKLVDAGRLPKMNQTRAQATLEMVKLDLEDAEHELRTAIRRLAAQWGELQPEFTAVSGNLRNLPQPADFSALVSRVEGNPELLQNLSENALREAELRLAQAIAKPSWRVSAGVRRHEQSDDVALVAGVVIPLATSDRNQGGIASARARLAATSADRDALVIRLKTQLFAFHQELLHSLHQSAAFRDQIIPLLEAVEADIQQAHESGRYSYRELWVVQAELVDARMASIEANANAHRMAVEIERLIGAPLPAADKQ
ncbi:MAG: TolC family protein [Woeseia sp.]